MPFPHVRPTKVVALAAAGILLFAGFGCRPVLDAQVQQNTNKPSAWIVEPPHFRYETYPDATGKIMLDLRSRPNTIVTVTLTGPGVDGEPTQSKAVEPEGGVRFVWDTNRLGFYEYTGTITFNQIVVESFKGDGETF